jgi:hypothetical protein
MLHMSPAPPTTTTPSPTGPRSTGCSTGPHVLLQRPQIRRVQSQQVEGQNVHGPRIRLANNSVASLLVDGVVNGHGPRAPFVDGVGADRSTAVTSVTIEMFPVVNGHGP